MKFEVLCFIRLRQSDDFEAIYFPKTKNFPDSSLTALRK